MTDETREQIRNDADAAFNEKRAGNIHFWTAKDDEPEVIFWKETWSAGATHQHPIAYSQGLAEGRRQAVEEALKELDHYKDLFEYKEDYFELKKELEKLKGNGNKT